MMRWRLHTREAKACTSNNCRSVSPIDQTLAEVRRLFQGWNCTSACDGSRYQFPFHFSWGHGGNHVCSNVYCVAPGVSDPDAR